MTRRLQLFVWCAFAIAPLLASLGAMQRTAVARIPAALSDKEFWDLTETASESNGSFQSDNFLSNERGYQAVIPALLQTAKPGGVYLGVGPEQNFPYIIALKPMLSVIFDIRRGNLQLHLLYKALFEMSADRADFLSRLFCIKRPAGLTEQSTVMELMTAYGSLDPSQEQYDKNYRDVIDWLTKKHQFALHADDLKGIDYVYRVAFFGAGPYLSYNIGLTANGRIGPVNNMVSGGTYAAIQALDDGRGVNRGYLGSEANWRAIKDAETRNLIVPVVGDFAGPTAIRAVGRFLKDRGAVVSAFYLSNVEQYLNRSRTEDIFLCNVAALPLDEWSTFIFTGTGRYGLPGGAVNVTNLRPMLPDARSCATSARTGVASER